MLVTRFRGIVLAAGLLAAIALSNTAARAADYNPYVTVDYLESAPRSTRAPGYANGKLHLDHGVGAGLDELPALPKLANAPKIPQAPRSGFYHLSGINREAESPQVRVDRSYGSLRLSGPKTKPKEHALNAK